MLFGLWCSVLGRASSGTSPCNILSFPTPPPCLCCLGMMWASSVVVAVLSFFTWCGCDIEPKNGLLHSDNQCTGSLLGRRRLCWVFSLSRVVLMLIGDICGYSSDGTSWMKGHVLFQWPAERSLVLQRANYVDHTWRNIHFCLSIIIYIVQSRRVTIQAPCTSAPTRSC